MSIQTLPLSIQEQFFYSFPELPSETKFFGGGKIDQTFASPLQKLNKLPVSSGQSKVDLSVSPFSNPGLFESASRHLAKYGVFYIIGGIVIYGLYTNYLLRKREEKMKMMTL